MRPFFSVIAIGIVAFVSRTLAPERDSLQAAAIRLGVRATQTLQFAGSGAQFAVGQDFAPQVAWPKITLVRYSALINYETASMRQDLVREMGTRMPRGGGVPFTGEQHEVETISGAYVWDEPIPPDPEAGSFPTAPCTPPEAGGTAPVSAPSPGSRAESC